GFCRQARPIVSIAAGKYPALRYEEAAVFTKKWNAYLEVVFLLPDLVRPQSLAIMFIATPVATLGIAEFFARNPTVVRVGRFREQPGTPKHTGHAQSHSRVPSKCCRM